jgi:hypothetical protein
MSAAPRTVLQIVQAAQAELGLVQSTSLVGNTTDLSAVQFLSLLNTAGEELRDFAEDGWRNMAVEFNLVVNTPITVTGNVTTNSPVITSISPNTTGIVAGTFMVSGNSIPTAARVQSVDSSTQVTMDMECTSGANGITLVFSQDTYNLPSDYKTTTNRTWWDRTNRWELLGPDSPQMDQWHRSGIVVTGPRRHFRQIGRSVPTQYRLWPQPSEIINPLQIVFEYQSTDWIMIGGVSTNTSSVVTSDTDTSFLDDRALIKWLKWLRQQAKGFAYDVMRNDAIDFTDTLIARDGTAPTLQMQKRVHPIFISPSNVQDGFFSWPCRPEHWLTYFTGGVGYILLLYGRMHHAKKGRSRAYRVFAKGLYVGCKNRKLEIQRCLRVSAPRYRMEGVGCFSTALARCVVDNAWAVARERLSDRPYRQ